ncbi:hypothetical protein [Desulfovibrio inopinatus]|uniref:hypothetical protein n=1 Tax=Desulfovibrio inopinatus TaxID=102109 RepID=UPI0004110827|nr:hypothetical protein [Desulfovibrio inopinatus]
MRLFFRRFRLVCFGCLLFISVGVSTAFSAAPDTDRADQAANATINAITAMLADLNLTFEQQIALAPIMTEQMSKAYKIYTAYQAGENTATIANDLQSLRNETYERITPLLTPEQLQKVEQMERQAQQSFDNTPTP